MNSFKSVFQGRRVLVTGHTGFKGGWLSLWLADLGAEVHGIALAPNTTPNFFDVTDLQALIHHDIQDICQRDQVIEKIVEIDPEFVFHLAAQPLVRTSYDLPLETFETNILGTAYVLEGCRRAKSTRSIVCVTTDKVYENNEWVWPYRENDRLGGKDPYSASKAAAEIVISCFNQSLLCEKGDAALASARGGNVIGGGDWSQDRLVPDLVRAINDKQNLTIRNPDASRPWQHVLALCHGYLQLAVGLYEQPDKHQGAWNFGPGSLGTVSVEALLGHFNKAWQLPEIIYQPVAGKTESRLLALDCSKAHNDMGWNSPWSLEEAVERTARWYRTYYSSPSEALTCAREQIADYQSAIIEVQAE